MSCPGHYCGVCDDVRSGLDVACSCCLAHAQRKVERLEKRVAELLAAERAAKRKARAR